MSVNTKINGELVPSAGLYKKSTPMSVATCYSEDEHKIGVWIDHKPLYQRTFDCGALPNATSKSVSISSIGIDKVVGFDAVGIDTETPDIIPIPVKTPNTSSQWGVSVQCYQNSIYLDTKANMSQYNAYVTLRYTKTIDNVTVSTYAPIVPMNIASKYSEDEKVVGQFIDGKPLYQKTVSTGALSIGANNILMGISNPENIVDIKITAFVESSGTKTTAKSIPLTYVSTSTIADYGAVSDGYNFSTDTVLITCGSQRTFTGGYIIIQYTKTTDTAGTGLYADDEATLGMLGDVDLENLADGDIIKYNGASGKFENVPKEVYSTTEQVIGTFMGDTLYRKVYSFNENVSVSMTAWTDLNSYVPNIGFGLFAKAFAIDSNGTLQGDLLMGFNASSHVQAQSTRNGNANISFTKLIIEYTKASS